MPRLARQRTLSQAERMAEIVRLRRERVTVIDIGKQLGISHQRVSQLYAQALREIPAAEVAEHRTEQQILIDDAMASLMHICADRNVSPRTRVEAWSAVRGWAEHEARILGLNAPARIEVSDATDQAIRALAAELAAGVGDVEPGGTATAAGDAEGSEVGTAAT